MKKKMLIILLSLALTASLFARGVTENVARDGVKGVQVYLEDLEKAGKDDRIPDGKREEIENKVYKGMTFEEAVQSSIQKDEGIKTTSQTTAPVKTEESSTPVVSEKTTPVKADESSVSTEKEPATPTAPPKTEESKPAVSGTTPAAHPEKAEESAPAVSGTTPTTLPVKTDVGVPAGSGKTEHSALPAEVEKSKPVVSDKTAPASLPAASVESLPAESKETAVVPSSKKDESIPVASGKVEASALPVKVEETSAVVGKTTPAEVKESVPVAVEEKEEATEQKIEKVPESSGPVYAETLTYKGLSTTVAVSSTKATLTVPSSIDKADIDAVADIVCAAYPLEASLVTYSLENGVLTLTYPKQSDEFLLSIMETLKEGGMYLIDLYEEVETTDKKAPEIVVEAEKNIAPVTADESAPVKIEGNVPAVGEEKKETEQKIGKVSGTSCPLYAETLTYKGLSTTVTVDSTKATLTVPSAIDKADIDAVADIVCAAYPEEASLVTYSFEDGVLTLTYPEQSDEFLLSVMETLKEGGMYLIDLYGEVETAAKETVDAVVETVEQVAEVVETVVDTAKALVEGFDLVVEKDGTIRAKFNYHDFAYASVVVEENSATITYPSEYIASSDIDAFMASAVEKFPSLLENVYYNVPEDGTLVIYFPADYVGGTYYRLEVLDELDREVTAYIDALLLALEEKSVEKIGSGESEMTVVVSSPSEEVEAATQETTKETDVPVYADTLSYNGLASAVEVYKTYAVLTVPEGITAQEVASAARIIGYLYPEKASLLTYSFDSNILRVSYPELSKEYLLSLIDVLKAEAVAFIDGLSTVKEEKIEVITTADKTAEKVNAVAAVEEKTSDVVFSGTFSYNGYTTDITVKNTETVLTIPQGITTDDIAVVAAIVAKEYPSQASLISYKIEDGKLILSYPEQSSDYLRSALEYIEREAKALLDLYPRKNEKVETVTAVETGKADTAATSVREEAIEAEAVEVAEALSPVAPVSPVSPVVPYKETETKKHGVFDYDITMSLKGKFRYYKGSDHIYPTFSVSMRDTFYGFLYIEAGVDTITYVKNKMLYIVSGLNMNAGLNVEVNRFDFFFYTGLRYQVASKSSSFKSGLSITVGAGVDLRLTNHLIFGAGYEYYASSSLFNFFVKYRF